MQVWQFIHNKLYAGFNVFLLWVVQSEGSSPGRQGFKMAIAEDGNFIGTIGGGIMEHKLVEKAKALLATNENSISLIHQYHDKQRSKEQSGMICSGSQMIAFVPLSKKDIPIINEIIAAKDNRASVVHLSPSGIRMDERKQCGLNYKTDKEWSYAEAVDNRPVIHIIGGGHVGLALSELMAFLGFYIKLYDNRPDLNTMRDNRFAHEKHIADYQNIGDLIFENEEEYVVIASFGYRDDKTIFKQLLDKKFFYLGMMGSEAKIKKLFKELQEEGFNPSQWQHCFVPIGINIHSRTTQEIAVSIAAEIIREKNCRLPTGRTGKEF